MCLYMNVPLWINVDHFKTAITTTATQLFDASALIVFLFQCKTSAAAATAAAQSAAAAAAATATAPASSATLHECKQLKQRQQLINVNTIATTKLNSY